MRHQRQDARVAVYLDFDNIVMSWYDRVHGKNSYARDRQRIAANDPEVAERLSAATIDVGAIIALSQMGKRGVGQIWACTLAGFVIWYFVITAGGMS